MTIKDIKIVPEYFATYTNKVPADLPLLDALETYGIEYLTAERDKYEAVGDQVYAPGKWTIKQACLLYTSPSPRDRQKSRMPSSA